MAKKKRSSDAAKNMRAASVARGQARKAARKAEQEARERANAARRAAGEATPWEEAKARRRLARATQKE